MVKISELPSTVLQSRDHELASEKDGLSARLSVAQILGLLLQDDIEEAWPELSEGLFNADVLNALTGKATLVNNDQFVVRDSVSGALRKHSYSQLLALLTTANNSRYPRIDASVLLSTAQRKQLADNLGGSWEDLGTTTLAAAAPQVAWTGLTGYRALRLRGYAQLSANGAEPGVQVGDNVSSWLNGNDYASATMYTSQGGSPPGANLITGSFFRPGGAMSSSHPIHLEMILLNVGTALPKGGFASSWTVDTAGNNQAISWFYRSNLVTARDALRIFPSTGNINANSWFQLEGHR